MKSRDASLDSRATTLLISRAMRTRTIVALALFSALPACGPSSADVEELKKGQKEILAKLEDLSKKAAAAPAAAPARPQIDPNKVYDLQVGASPVAGAKDGKVTIVEFSDYQCPFCGQAEPLVDQVMAAYPKDVKRVYKQFPLTSIHPNALPASKAAVAAGKQGKFWEMHKKLFDNQRELSPDNYKKWAGEIGLNVAQFEKDMAAPEVQAQIDKDTQEARAADVTGTPTIFVNGKRLMKRSFDGFKEAIDAALAAKG
jgi:protein-disulfide isomerase